MKDSVYSSLREETLQLFSAVRTVAIGEVGAMLIIVSTMLNLKSPLGTAALFFTACGLLVFTTRLGQHWFLQALRQSTYLFLAHDVAEFRNTSRSNLQDYWILASRSESAFRKKHAGSGKGPHIHMGGDLERFIDQQIWLLGFAALAALVAFVLAFSAPAHGAHTLVAAMAAVSMLIVTAAYVFVQRRAVQDYAPKLAEFWKIYLENREEHDLAYLKGVDLGE